MSRSGYIDDYDCDDVLAMGRWRGIVSSTIRSKRGQAFLREMLAAMDAMPQKRLIANELRIDGFSAGGDDLIVGADELVACDGNIAAMGEVCAIGSVGNARGIDMSDLDPEDPLTVARAFGIAEPMVQEIVYQNDECGGRETPEQRFVRMRAWIVRHIETDTTEAR